MGVYYKKTEVKFFST